MRFLHNKGLMCTHHVHVRVLLSVRNLVELIGADFDEGRHVTVIRTGGTQETQHT